MKKKIMAVVLVTTMVICNSITVWAADKWGGDYDPAVDGSGYSLGTENNANKVSEYNNGGDKNVTATFDLGDVAEVLSVDISWGALSYKPIGTLSGTWDPAGYYKVEGFNGWTESIERASEITVDNNSNVKVYAEFRGEVLDTYKENYMLEQESIDVAGMTFTSDASENVWDDSYKILVLDTVLTENAETTATIDVGVNAKLEKSKEKKIQASDNLVLGTVTITLSEDGFNG